MKGKTPNVFLVAAAFVVLTTVLAELQYWLPGINQAITAAGNSLIEQLRTMQSIAQDTAFGSYITSAFSSSLASNLKPFGVFLAFIISILTPVVGFGFQKYCLRTTRSGDGDFKMLFDGFSQFGKVFLLNLAIGFFIFLWSLLFVIPGIIAALRYSQAFYILMDNPDMGVLECIRESKELMRDNKLDLFLLQLSFIGWIFLSTLVSFFIPASVPFTIPIVSFWLTPYMEMSFACYYNHLIRYVPPEYVG